MDLDVVKPYLPIGFFEHAQAPEANGPGWPGSGGGSWARKPYAETGSRQHAFATSSSCAKGTPPRMKMPVLFSPMEAAFSESYLF